MLEATSQDSTSAKSLAQFKRGLGFYMENGNNGPKTMILKQYKPFCFRALASLARSIPYKCLYLKLGV